MRASAAVLMVVLLMVGSGGCAFDEAAREQVAAAREQVTLLSQDIKTAQAQLEVLESQVAALPEGPERARALGLVDRMQAYLERAVPALEVAERRLGELETAEGWGDAVAVGGEAVREIGEKAPPPWGVYLAWAGTLIAALGRAWQNRRNGRKVAAAVNETDRLNHLTEEEIKLLNRIEGPGGRRLVDEAQGKAIALPF